MQPPLNKKTLLNATRLLAARDKRLKRIVSDFGPPPLWKREEGFHTLVHIILEQQVSLASAKAAYDKLCRKIESVTPDRFLTLSSAELRLMGFSRQKTAYCRNVADALVSGDLDLQQLSKLDDGPAKEALMRISGIGPWTAGIYLLMALGRPDIWPKEDLALASAVQKLDHTASRPSSEELEAMSLNWKPWRAVAARILWHYYLSTRKTNSSP